MKKLLTLCSFVVSLGLVGCAAPPQNSQVYRSSEVGVPQTVQYGRVEAVRSIIIDAGTTGVGVGTGAILGGVAGSAIGHGGGSLAAGIIGAVAGGIAGQAVERNTSKTQGVELTIKLDRGPQIIVVQPFDNNYYNPGSKVRIIGNGSNTRVTF
jgi:outer membrane lipoprotein SlyB